MVGCAGSADAGLSPPQPTRERQTTMKERAAAAAHGDARFTNA
jgi:hypothetical protein